MRALPHAGAPSKTRRHGWASGRAAEHSAEGPTSRQPGRYSQESSGTHLMVESDRQRRCARNSGYRGWFFELVMAVTSAAEGGCQRGNSAGGKGKGEFVPKNETSQTQRVTGRSPEQPSPKCCSKTSLLGYEKYGNGTDGLFAVTTVCTRTPKVISDGGGIRIPPPE